MDAETKKKVNDFLEGLNLPYLCILVDDEGLAQFSTNLPVSNRIEVMRLAIAFSERGEI